MPFSSLSRHFLHRLFQRLPWRLQQLWRRIIGIGGKRCRTTTTAITAKTKFSISLTENVSPEETILSTTPTTATSRLITSTVTATSSTTVVTSSTTHHHNKSHSAAAAYVAILVLSTTCSLCAGSPCQPFNWWNPVKDKCIPCTECNGQLIVLRPCQLHRDTICGSIYDLQIDWLVLAKTEPNWKERRKVVEIEKNLERELRRQQEEDSFAMDWQTTALLLAVVACLLFFLVAAFILIIHMRQWSRMERRLDQDVEELSAKLMASLAQVQVMEGGGTFFLENADTIKGQENLKPHKVLTLGKERSIVAVQPGNVYIEEASSKG